MNDTTQMQKDLEFLVQEVKTLRKERNSLRSRLVEYEEQTQSTAKTEITLRDLNNLTAGILHDLRGGLGVIHNLTGFILDDLDTDSQLADDVRKIVYSADYCEIVLRNLESLGGTRTIKPSQVNVAQVARDAFFMLQRKLVDVELDIEGSSDESTILADEGQIQQMFVNLIKNAAEAMPEGGTLTIRFSPNNGQLTVDIADTGIGIPPENLDQIFDLHFTTKESGFGIGLHIVKEVVKQHNGAITVASGVGQGTTFTITLPIE